MGSWQCKLNNKTNNSEAIFCTDGFLTFCGGQTPSVTDFKLQTGHWIESWRNVLNQPLHAGLHRTLSKICKYNAEGKGLVNKGNVSLRGLCQTPSALPPNGHPLNYSSQDSWLALCYICDWLKTIHYGEAVLWTAEFSPKYVWILLIFTLLPWAASTYHIWSHLEGAWQEAKTITG